MTEDFAALMVLMYKATSFSYNLDAFEIFDISIMKKKYSLTTKEIYIEVI